MYLTVFTCKRHAGSFHPQLWLLQCVRGGGKKTNTPACHTGTCHDEEVADLKSELKVRSQGGKLILSVDSDLAVTL